MTRRKYLRDSVTGKPYDPATGRLINEELVDVLTGDLLALMHIKHGESVNPVVEQAPAHTNIPVREEKPYTPPPGIPADPVAWLTMLRNGPVSEEAARYLRDPTALAQYDGANQAGTAAGVSSDVTALADEISAAWHAWLAANPAPATGDLFNP